MPLAQRLLAGRAINEEVELRTFLWHRSPPLVAGPLQDGTKKAALARRPKSLNDLVGVTGFELGISTSRRDLRSTLLFRILFISGALQLCRVELTRKLLSVVFPCAHPSLRCTAESHDLAASSQTHRDTSNEVCLVHASSSLPVRTAYARHVMGWSDQIQEEVDPRHRLWPWPASLCTGAYSLTRRVGG